MVLLSRDDDGEEIVLLSCEMRVDKHRPVEVEVEGPGRERGTWLTGPAVRPASSGVAADAAVEVALNIVGGGMLVSGIPVLVTRRKMLRVLSKPP